MRSAFRRFLTKDKDTKKCCDRKFRDVLDVSTVCVVSVDTLRCIICLNIYQGIPQTLSCGHSFCMDCIEELVKACSREESSDRSLCPVCRRKTLEDKPTNNYTMQAVLDSIHLISENEENARRSYDNTIEASNEQYRLKCIQQERIIDKMKREINEVKRKEKYNYVAIAFFIIVYIMLTTMYGY